MSSRVLVTGGAGFIGSHLVDALVARGDSVVVIDRLSTGGSRANLEQHDGSGMVELLVADVCDAEAVRQAVDGVELVIHAAAESHVDRSIEGPGGFLRSNTLGTGVVLEACREAGVRMVMISTDEVYGPGDAGGGLFDEDAPLRPKSPYAASKAAADLLCQSYVSTYGADVTVVRGTNAYGPRQIERVIPTYAVAAAEGRDLPVYGQGRQRREFLHVRDWAAAVLAVADRGAPGVTYNIGDGYELENLDLAERILALAGDTGSQIAFVPDRPGHDFRYGVSADRLRSLGWTAQVAFDDGLAETFAWYRDHLTWLQAAHDTPIVTAPRGS